MFRTGSALALAILLTGVAEGQTSAVVPPAPPSDYVDGPTWRPVSPDVFGHLDHAPYQDRNGPLLKGDPRLDGPPYAPPGWFAAVDVVPVGLHLKNSLTNTVALDGRTDTVDLGTAAMGWTVMPRFEFGYRFGQASGEVLVAYHFIEANRSGTVDNFTPAGLPGDLHSRLDLNAVDLEYASREFPLAMGPGWDMKWLAGARLASVFFDSQAAALRLRQHESNNFVGAGPVVGLELWRHLEGMPGLSLYCHVDAAFLMGTINEFFDDTVTATDGTPRLAGATQQRQAQGVPVLSVQAGLGWQPADWEHVRFALGYQLEDWWNIGRDGSSRAELSVQGIFLRGEWRY
jgi:hypothetical protein